MHGVRQFLTPDRVQHRYNTLIDAFNTADRRQRGFLAYDRVMEIYALFFHASVGELEEGEVGQRFRTLAFGVTFPPATSDTLTPMRMHTF